MAQVQEQQQQVSISINDLIYAQVKDLGKRMDRLEKNLDLTRTELNSRTDRIERRMDKQDEKIERLADKIDELRNEMKSSSNHGRLINITIADIGLFIITLGVLYALIFK